MSKVLDLIRGLVGDAETGDVTAANTPPLGDDSKKLATTEFMMDAFTGDGKQSLTANGYQKFPGGLIVQWGNATVNAGATVTVTLPTPMESAIRSASVVANTTGDVYGTILSFTQTTFQIKNHGTVNCAFFWMVIGY